MIFPDRIKVVGLTGVMCSGKSSVAAFWQENFVVCWISADLAGRKLLEPGRPGWQRIKELVPVFIRADQHVDRSGLRRALFGDDALRHDLDQALHPLIREEVWRQVADRAAGIEEQQFFLVEVPLLYEVGWEKDFAEIIVIYVDNHQLCRRLSRRDMISVNEAERALACQRSGFDKAMLADHVIDNSRCWSLTVLQLLHLGRLLWAKKT